ncbi:oxidoreductase [Nocardioidaceae bacterium]|nr:oxidoreductase [Nocardioidaceae bacterium]
MVGLASWEGVGSGLAAARDGIDALLRDRGMRRVDRSTTAEALLRGAYASATLEGSTATLEEVRAEGGDDLARAAVRLHVELLGLLGTFRTAPAQALARMHVLVAPQPDSAGRPRSPEAAARLTALARRLQQGTAAPALLEAAMAHAEVATLQPFGSRDGLVARGLERLVLAARGVDPVSVTVPEAGHLALRAAYESNLRGYRDGGSAGVHSWLLYAGEAFAAGAEASPLSG